MKCRMLMVFYSKNVDLFEKSKFWIKKVDFFSARTSAIFADYLIAPEQKILKKINKCNFRRLFDSTVFLKI